MHPILARGRRLALYVGLWLLLGGLLGALLVVQASLTWWHALIIALPLTYAYAFVCLSVWYLTRSMPLAITSAARVLGTAVAAAAITSSGWLLLAKLWVRALASRGWVPASVLADAALDSLIFGLGVLLYLLSLAISYLLVTFEATREAEQRALRGQVLSREAELRSLRAQIDPHFLFNSLHSISSLTATDAVAARRMCLLLAQFLRESLELGSQERIPLARELKMVEHFLEVEQVRFGERLQVAISDGDAGACLVPPLLLQPVVENAVTHGVSHQLEGGTVAVTVTRSDTQLKIVVENPADPDRPRRTGTGLGLANVRARLAALHGSEARMQTSEIEGVWRTELVLPAVMEPAAVQAPGGRDRA
jgi:two-component system, LytTR family, sensor histidine kinase AlgZ